VLVFTLVAFVVTIIFRADVNAQGGAYATGVLVLITSAAVAVTVSARRAGQRRATTAYGVISAVLVYATIANVIERPEGAKIATCFIIGIIVVSFLSRVVRAFELRVTAVHLKRLRLGPPRWWLGWWVTWRLGEGRVAGLSCQRLGVRRGNACRDRERHP
jgi:hypothetical protein